MGENREKAPKSVFTKFLAHELKLLWMLKGGAIEIQESGCFCFMHKLGAS